MGKMLFAVVSAFMVSFCLSLNARAVGMIGGKEFVAEYVYDFAADGGAIGVIDLSAKGQGRALPTNAKILSIHSEVLTALTSGGAATVAIGDVASGTRYLAATAYNNAAYVGLKALSSGLPFAVSAANEGKVAITIAGAALTAGKMKLYVRGYIPSQR